MRRAVILLWIFLLLLAQNFAVLAQDGEGEGEEDLAPPPPLAELNEANIKQATVFLMQVLDTPTGPVVTCTGSGTLVSADGLILTNAHVVSESDICQSDRVVVALTVRLDKAPVPTYIAEILDVSAGLDLAVLQITSFIDGRLVDRGALQLPFIEIGDSTRVQLDDTIMIVGYPDIGSSPAASILGTISGFTAEARVGDRAWLRTTANIPGGISGGGAYNLEGRLIGIPTISPVRVGGEALNCRIVTDSNGDGQIDDEDICIPIGGSITTLRPARLARGLVRAARLGIRVGEERAPAVFSPPSAPPDFRRLIVTTGVNDAGMPINVMTQVPAGTTSMYLFFDYVNMQDGMVYELRTTINGRPSPTFSLPPVTWNGGPRGTWYIGSAGVPLQNGVYEFTMFTEGRQVASHQITVGGAPSGLPAFSDVSFGLDSGGLVVGTNFILPETNIVRAQFNYRNMLPGLPWTQIWYIEAADGYQQLTAPITGQWAGAEQGVSQEAAITSEVPLLSGRYRLELLIEDRLVATSDFVVAGGAEAAQAQIFSNFRFTGNQVAGTPQPPIGEEFATNAERLYVFFNWRGLSQLTPWTWRWKVDGETLIENHTVWATAPTGDQYYLSLMGEPALPDATYTFEIDMGGIIVASVEAKIGLGQLPLGVFASAEGVQVTGYIRDAESGDGIPGALFILLKPEFDVSDYTGEAAQILSMSLADDDGYFQLPILLPRGTREEPLLYSMLISSDGYFPMTQDGIAVTDITESPMEIAVELNHD